MLTLERIRGIKVSDVDSLDAAGIDRHTRAYVHVAMGVVGGCSDHPSDAAHLRRLQAPWFEITDDLPQFDEL